MQQFQVRAGPFSNCSNINVSNNHNSYNDNNDLLLIL